MIWILGEYCDRIDGVDEQLTPFVENFHDENVQVSALCDQCIGLCVE